MKVAAIVPAAGRGKRFGAAAPKPFVKMAGKPLLAHTLSNLLRSHRFTEILVAVHPAQMETVRRLFKRYALAKCRMVIGGKSRAESVRNAFFALGSKADWVLIHDAARPLIEPGMVRRLLRQARTTGAAILAEPVSATVKCAPDGKTISATADRRALFLAQTPQVFKKDLLVSRYRAIGKRALTATDEAALFDGTRVRISLVMGSPKNIKITTSEDRQLFEFYLGLGTGPQIRGSVPKPARVRKG